MHDQQAVPLEEQRENSSRVLERLSALADEISAALSGQAIGGRHLVEALSDQLAEGQVETLYTIQSASADLRHRSADFTTAAKVTGDALAMSLETRLAVETVTIGVEMQRQAGLASDVVREGIEAGLRGLTAGADQVDVAQLQLTASADKVATALEVAAVRWPIAARQVRDDVLDAGRTAATAVEGAGGRIDQAATKFQVLIDGLMSRLDSLRDEVIGASEQTVDDLHVTTTGLIEALQNQVRAQERRDALVDRKVQERVQQLVARTDAAVTALTASFAVEVARLVERDVTLEKQRVAEFTRVLDQVLSQPGLRRRSLRSRIRKTLATTAPIPATPVVVPSVPVPPARRPRKAASPKREDAT